MRKDFEQHISDTAFLVNESRARMVDTSKDVYARAWVPEAARERVRALWDDFSEQVYPYDDLELSVRNRFFIERINRFISSHDDAVFVNLGAGLTSYPYLMERSVDCFEIDFPHVIRFKQRRAAILINQQELPPRQITYVDIDLGSDDARNSLTQLLQQRLVDAPSFVLLEGVSYYLNTAALDALFVTMADLQKTGSVFAFDFWRPDLMQHPVFQRLLAFFEQRFGFESRDYCLIDETFIDSIPAYAVIEMTNVTEMEPVYASSKLLVDHRQILPENYAVLERR